MMTIRNVCLYLVALDPPASIVELYDPLINKIFYRGEQITRDLFFSGHTATLLVFGLSLVPRNHKKIFISLAAVMGISVLVQHIHYSIDVGAAFLFTYISAVITRNIFNKTGLKNLKTM
jgi:membrane-associated phospholipid phosphatase